MKRGDQVFIRGSKGVAQVTFLGYDSESDTVLFTLDGDRVTGVPRTRWNTMVTEIDLNSLEDLPEDEAL